MPRRALTLLAGLALALALALPRSAAADTGPYLDFASWPSFAPGVSTMGTTFIGPEGVPQVQYAWGAADNPVTVCQWALQRWSWWTATKDPADLAAVTTAANWLVAHQQPDGGIPYGFDFDALGVPLHAPWISAMTQGEAMSLLVRAYSATGDARYLDAALLALGPFEKPTTAGGVVSSWAGLPWYEEYPGAGEEHVLNGFEFSLVGLHDLAPYSPEAQRLFDVGVTSLAARLPLFDDPTARDQWYAALGGGHFVVPEVYKHIHAVLTSTLASATGNPVLADYAARWNADLSPLPPAATTPPAAH